MLTIAVTYGQSLVIYLEVLVEPIYGTSSRIKKSRFWEIYECVLIFSDASAFKIIMSNLGSIYHIFVIERNSACKCHA